MFDRHELILKKALIKSNSSLEKSLSKQFNKYEDVARVLFDEQFGQSRTINWSDNALFAQATL
jgi:hypothetical protein